jgi:AcrR family transcriptional regulator
VATPATSRRGQRDAKPRHGDRREQTILEATRSLLAEIPFSDLTIGQIATAAAVSRSSLYFYFADKAQILLLLYSDVLEQMSAELERWFADPDKHAEPWSRASIAAAVTVARRNANVVCAALDNRGTNPEIDGAWTMYFDRAVERSALLIERERAAGLAPSGGPSAQALARALMHMTLHSIHELLRSGVTAADGEELIETLTVLWARGVGTDPA